MNAVKYGSWSEDCLSRNRIAAYAQYYTFTLTSTQTVTIDLKSSKYTFLILLDGSGIDGSVIQYDANGDGTETNSQIITTLGRGTYTIEATTSGTTTSGAFTLSLSNLPPPPTPCIVSPITIDTDVSGSWTPSCVAESDRYSQYYTFTLLESQEVIIDLKSARDTYLTLLNGSTIAGSVIATNRFNPNGSGSQIDITLEKGTYTVRASTWSSGTSGDFVVSVNSAIPNCEGSISPMAIDTYVSGNWTSSCVAESDRYSRYYTFKLLETQEVTIDLNSSQDTYLALLGGSTIDGSVIATNHNNPNGSGSQIVITLEKGTYTVQASSWTPRTSGDFVVSVSSVIPNCEDSISPMAIDTNVSGSWTSSCVDESDRYSQYYTFTLLESQKVTIDLNSSQDTYLALLGGSTIDGSVIATNHKNPNGSGSQLVIILEKGDYTVQASSWAPATSGDFVVSMSAAIPPCVDCQFMINANLNDVWFNTNTSGQGFLIIVFPHVKQMFVAWFTFDVERPPEDAVAVLGSPGQRWLTAQGPYDGDTANLTLYVTKGGVFDSGSPAASTEVQDDGTMTIEFADCKEGLVNYDITSLGISGEIPIQRVVDDNVPACESFLDQFWSAQ
ncbi:PPC domain-containing protein [Pseudomonadota bacterium]